VSEVGLTTDVPLVDPPVLNFEPEHDVAFELDQVRVELPPRMILVGLALREAVTVAADPTVTLLVPTPLRVGENLLLAVPTTETPFIPVVE
jgi:hypothetical protein